MSDRLRKSKHNYRKSVRPPGPRKTYSQKQLQRSPLYAIYNPPVQVPRSKHIARGGGGGGVGGGGGGGERADLQHTPGTDGEEDGQEPLDPSERSLKSMPYMGDKFSTRGDYTEGMTMLSRFKDSHEYLYKLAPLRCKYRHQLGLGSTTPLPTRDHGYGSGEATPYEAGGGGGGGGSGSMWAQSGKDAGRRRGKGHKGHHHTAPANFATSRVSVCGWVGERAGVYVG